MRILLLGFLAVLSAAGPAVAQPAAAQPAVAQPAAAQPAAPPAGASQASIGSVPPGVLRATLPNGLRVVIVPDHLAPVVATALNYLVGSTDAPDGFPGTAHALEHMMFRGAAGLDRDQLSELGALLGGNYNASTTETVTQYTFTVPNTDLPTVLRIEAGRMRGLNLTEADWQQERGAIEQEVSRDLSSPMYTHAATVQAALFGGTPYSHDALGTRESFDKTTAADLRTFYDRWYHPNNAILVIAGDVDPAAALAQVHAAFDAIPAAPIPDHAAIPALPPVHAETLHETTNLPFGLVSIDARFPGTRSPDFAAADVLGDVLGTPRGALYALVPGGQALLAEFSFNAKSDVGIGSVIAGFPGTADPAPLVAAMQAVLARLVADGVPPELVEAAKQQEVAQLAFSNDSIVGLARLWSRALATSGLQSPDQLSAAYAAVTVDDVNRMARTLLRPADAIVAILTPGNTGRAPTAGGFGGTESFAAPPPGPVTLPDWAAQALLTVPKPVSGPEPTVTVLPNGLTLLVQPEHVGRTISVFGRVRTVAATEQPPGKEGIAALTGQMFDQGSTRFDRLGFAAAMDAIAAQYTSGFQFSLRVLTPHFADGMRLLAETELHPAFPEPVFTVRRSQLAQTVAGEIASPGYRASRAMEQALVPMNDPVLRQATPATVAALTLADVHAFYTAAFRPDLATVVVVGDVTPEQARQVVEETFGGWTAAGPRPDIDLPPLPPSGASRYRLPDDARLQDGVALAETMPTPVTSPDRYALLLGNGILGGDFSSRLYRDLRIRTGYVYTVSSTMDWSRTRARYAVGFGADAGNVAKARALVVDNLRAMATTLVSEGELARAKAGTLRRLPMGRASTAGIAGTFLRLAELGLPFDTPRRAAELSSAVTAEDIRRAFAAAVRPDALAEVILGPPLAP